MTDPELEALLVDLESDRSERKEAATDMERIQQVICAFANDIRGTGLPGYLFVGARDDGSAAGLAVTDKLLLDLSGIRDQGNILPQPRMTVTKRTLRGGDMAVVEVFPAPLPPVRFKGVVWIRVGPRRARANEAEERALSERRAAVAGRTWDARPCDGATTADLALDLFAGYRAYAVEKAVVDENHRTVEEQLASLRFLDRRTGVSTNAGILLFGKDPRYFVPGAYVQLVAYEGTTAASDVVRERVMDGDLASVLRLLDDAAKETVRARLEQISVMREQTVYDYPPEAVREAWVNAVIHRDYESNTPTTISIFSDRIEVLSPGGLYGDLPREAFPGMTAYRNPVVAEAAKVLGYVNRFGRGVPRIVESMKTNGSPSPVLAPHVAHFLVTLPRRP